MAKHKSKGPSKDPLESIDSEVPSSFSFSSPDPDLIYAILQSNSTAQQDSFFLQKLDIGHLSDLLDEAREQFQFEEESEGWVKDNSIDVKGRRRSTEKRLKAEIEAYRKAWSGPGTPGIEFFSWVFEQVKATLHRSLERMVHHTEMRAADIPFFEDEAQYLHNMSEREIRKLLRGLKRDVPRKAGRKPVKEIRIRKRIVRKHIKKKRDFYDAEIFYDLLRNLHFELIPSPIVRRRRKSLFSCTWVEVQDDTFLKEAVIKALNEDRWSRKERE